MNFQEIQNCIMAIKPTMKAPYKGWLAGLILDSENYQNTKSNLQTKMELLKNDSSYKMGSCPVWRAIQTQQCPSGEKLVSFDKKTNVFKMNIEEKLTSAQKATLKNLIGGLLN